MPTHTLPPIARAMPHGAIAMARAKARRAVPREAARVLRVPASFMDDPDLPLLDPEFDSLAGEGIGPVSRALAV